MGDENRTEELSAQLQAMESKIKATGFQSVDELASAYQKANEQREQFRGDNDEARKIISQKSNEIGGLKAKVSEMEGEVAELKKKSGSSESDGNQDGKTKPKEKPEETADDIDATLTDLQRKRAEEVYAQQDVKTQQKIHRDPEFRKNFLLCARDAEPDIPDTPWNRPEDKQPRKSTSQEEIAAMFNTQVKRNGYTPPGGSAPGSRSKTAGGAPKGESKRFRISGGGQDLLSSLESQREAQ